LRWEGILLWLEKLRKRIDSSLFSLTERQRAKKKEAKEADCMIEQEQVEIKTILFIILNFFTQANNHGDIVKSNFSTFVAGLASLAG
jgi:hypothetical protein